MNAGIALRLAVEANWSMTARRNVGLCPLYALARINTCSENEDA